MNAAASNPNLAEILLVDDNPADIRLMQETLKEDKIVHRLHVVMDGEECMQFLRKEGEYADKPRPDLLLLDLNLPRKDGREALAEIKADPNLKTIPIVVLTSSEADQDILKSYELQASCYITKPVDLEQFTEVVRSIQDFWFAIVKLPKA
jgi:CheY-like chemotaxis protein